MLLDELIEMPRIRNAIDLEELPSHSTLCKAFNRFDNRAKDIFDILERPPQTY